MLGRSRNEISYIQLVRPLDEPVVCPRVSSQNFVPNSTVICKGVSLSNGIAIYIAIQQFDVTCSHLLHNVLCVAVPCRNRRLFHHVFQSHCCLWGVLSSNFCQGQGLYALCRFIRYSCNYVARMSPNLNGSLAVWRFKHSNALKIRDGITFNSYTGLPHVHLCSNKSTVQLAAWCGACSGSSHCPMLCLFLLKVPGNSLFEHVNSNLKHIMVARIPHSPMANAITPVWYCTAQE